LIARTESIFIRITENQKNECCTIKTAKKGKRGFSTKGVQNYSLIQTSRSLDLGGIRLFAKKQIKSGTMVIQYKGKVSTNFIVGSNYGMLQNVVTNSNK
jgi:hypothetical protein